MYKPKTQGKLRTDTFILLFTSRFICSLSKSIETRFYLQILNIISYQNYYNCITIILLFYYMHNIRATYKHCYRHSLVTIFHIVYVSIKYLYIII